MTVPFQKQTKKPERLTYFFLNRFPPKRNHKVPTASSPFPLLSLKYIPFLNLAWSRKFSNIYFLYIKRKGGPPFMECGNMGVFDRGVQMLLTTVGAFAAFSLMTIAVGTDYWLYSRGVCKVKSNNENETSKKNEEVMTHSGLWRTCCLEGKTTLIMLSLIHPMTFSGPSFALEGPSQHVHTCSCRLLRKRI